MRFLWLTLISAGGLQLAAFSQTTPIHRGKLLSNLDGNEKSITNVQLSASDLTRGTVGSAVLTGSNAYNGRFTGEGAGLTNLPFASVSGLGTAAYSNSGVFLGKRGSQAVTNGWTLFNQDGWTGYQLNNGQTLWFATNILFSHDGGNSTAAQITNGTIIAANGFFGNGAGLTNLTASAQTPWNQTVNANQKSLTNGNSITLSSGLLLEDLQRTPGAYIIGGGNLVAAAGDQQLNNTGGVPMRDAGVRTFLSGSFIAGSSYSLASVTLQMGRFNAGVTGTVRLRVVGAVSDLPTGTLLGVSETVDLTTLTDAGYPHGATPTVFTFTIPPTITAGTTNCLVLECPTFSGLAITVRIQNAGGVGDIYGSTDNVTWPSYTLSNYRYYFTSTTTDSTLIPAQLSLFASSAKQATVTNVHFGPMVATNARLVVVPGYPPVVSWLNGTGGPVNLTVSGTITGNGAGLTNIPTTGLTNTGNFVTTSNAANIQVTNLNTIWLRNTSLTLKRSDGTPQAVFTLNGDNTIYNGLAESGGGIATDTGFTGDGAGLTNLPAVWGGISNTASSGTNVIIANTSTTLQNGGANTLVVTNGSVGLGTATPTALLTVNGPASFSNDVAIVGASSALTIAGTVIGNTTITATTGFLLPTNYSAAAFVPTTAMGTLVISNAVLYFVTTTQTNLISDGR